MAKSKVMLPCASSVACLLLYVNCGFEAMWRKYKILGNFSDKWWDFFEIAAVHPIHIAARDAVAQGSEALHQLYTQRVMFDKERTSTLISNGTCVRIHKVQ